MPENNNLGIFQGKTEAQIEFLRQSIDKQSVSLKELAEQLDNRITNLEMWKATITAKASLVAFIAAAGSTILVNWITHRVM